MNNRTGGASSTASTSTPTEGDPVSGVEVGSCPPGRRNGRGPRSLWPQRLAVGRANPGTWIRVIEPFSRTTAAQLASDLRNAHTRNPRTLRVRGVLPGEVWETAWGPLDGQSDDSSEFFIWFRLARASE